MTAGTFRLDLMDLEDIAEVGRVEKRCFSNPWPQSAYRRELRYPEQNYYIVLRDLTGEGRAIDDVANAGEMENTFCALKKTVVYIELSNVTRINR